MYHRDNKGKYARRAHWTIVACGIFAISIAVLTVVETLGASELSYASLETDARLLAHKYADDEIAAKITKLENDVLSTLQNCESGGHPDPDGIIIFDSNNEASVGRFQWQRASVIHYYKTLYSETINKSQAIAIAINSEKATQLTRDVLFTTKNGWKNWYICSTKNGIPAQVELINKLKK